MDRLDGIVVSQVGNELKTVVMTLGMHRSGTSLLSAALECLGVDFGEHLIAPRPDNPRGFWEDSAIVELNEQVFAAQGSSSSCVGVDGAGLLGSEAGKVLQRRMGLLLDQRLACHDLFGIKDPRLPRLMDFWMPLLDARRVNVALVVPVRHPLSVAASLQARDGFSTAKSLMLWYEHMYRALRFAVTRRMVVVDYDLFMAQPRESLLRIADRLGLPFSEASFQCFSVGILDRSLRHTCFDASLLQEHADAFPALVELHDLLCGLARDAEQVCARRIEAMERQFADVWPLLRHFGQMDQESWRTAQWYLSDHKRLVAREAELVGWISRLESTVQAGETAHRQAAAWFEAQEQAYLVRLQAVERERDALLVSMKGLRGALASSEATQSGLRAELSATLERLESILSSRSWRATEPLRRCAEWVGRIGTKPI
ncbi:sulfotransferase family protein [Pseudomonas delhiensis]|nr:sulfotransferase family protein [Pseudomonas delhiensis]